MIDKQEIIKKENQLLTRSKILEIENALLKLVDGENNEKMIPTLYKHYTNMIPKSTRHLQQINQNLNIFGSILEHLGRSWEGCWSPDADVPKHVRFLIPSNQVGVHVGPEKCVF